MQNRGWSTSDLRQYLQGCDFPCSKSHLLDFCRQKNCPQDVLNTLQSLPDRQYNSLSDVMANIGQVE